MIYKVSYVVRGGEHPGGIRNEDTRPEVGDTVKIGPRVFQIVEVYEMMPPRDGFQFLHAVITTQDRLDSEEKYW
jgi:hypothetical protein